MRAVIVQRDTPAGVLIADVPTPVPSASEALVRVAAAAVNPTDLAIVAHAPDGVVAGHEVAGTIEEPAADGSGPAPGTRVTGLVTGGGWAEVAAVPTSQLVPVPDSISTDTAATLPLAGLSALRALRALGPTIGRRVLITGASGSVGTLAVQLSAISGAAHISALARDRQVHALLRDAGATSVSDSVDTLLGEFDGVIDTVGGPTLTEAFALLTSNGTLLSVGRASGQDVVLTPEDLRADGGGSGRTVRTFFMPDEGTAPREDLEFLLHLAATGRLRLATPHSVPLERSVEMIQTPSLTGKLVLRPHG
jgi:NADPH2:quinone reductase